MKSAYVPLVLALSVMSPRPMTTVYAGDTPATQPSDAVVASATQPSDAVVAAATRQSDEVAAPWDMPVPKDSEPIDRDIFGGGTRNGSGVTFASNLFVNVIAPKRPTSLATHFQSPRLVFYVSRATMMSIRVAIREEAPRGGIGQTPLEWMSDADAPRQMSAGLHMIDLAICNVRLKPGVLYRWSVSIPPVNLNDQSQQHEHWGRIKYDPSAPASGSFYDEIARAYDSLLSNPKDASNSEFKRMLAADPELNFCQILIASPPEPPTLVNPQGN